MLVLPSQLSFPSPRLLFVLSFILCILFQSAERSSAQASPKTEPAEVKALNTILGRWGKQALWNTTGDPCSGAAIDSTDFDDNTINPFIKCDCGFKSNTTCHITRLKVYALNVVGTIPDELQDLPYLTNLKLGQNFLTGPLPAFIGNLTPMRYLDFGINALSGPIPAELGKLQNLIILSIGTNNFSGPVPPQFGNLTSLQQLYVDSSGLSGELPSTLSKLKNMQTMWASDNNFSGKIPDFVTSWPNLNVLRFQGNSFEGPIPSSYSSLTNLTDLRIGDIVNGSSSLAFISNFSSLSSLILRNCKISDTMPSYFLSNLQILDLSFNNITGLLPPDLFVMSSLQILFLGNNSLSGSLPTEKSIFLSNIDLSYNQLSGSFPPWVNPIDPQFASGLACLQHNVPCNRGSPICMAST